MSEQNYMLISKALNTILRPTLAGLVGQQLSTKFGADWWRRGVLSKLNFTQKRHLPVAGSYEQLTDKLDAQLSLLLIDLYWDEIFADDLPPTFFNYFKELKTIRNLWAHRDETNHFDDRYTARALDTMIFIAEEFDDNTADKLRRLRDYGDERTLSTTAEHLPAWRDVIEPNSDVSAGEYSQAEWAVNLASVVFERDGRPEYTEPAEFFSRTYLTDGLKKLLVEVTRRVSKGNGEPVIQLKTAFGGGKTHSLLALYHLFGGKISAEKSSAVREILEAANVATLPKVNTAVFVGTWTNPLKSTLWGEIAAQLSKATGKPELYEMMRENDEQKISPGAELLKKLFNAAGACLILIDELVAYGRTLRSGKKKEGGTLDNFLTFIQALTEAAKASPKTAVVASIPESEAEIGGGYGREVCAQLEKYFGRMEFVWTPVSHAEGYEIVRRRLFRTCKNESAREKVCAAFYRMYVENKNDFPSDSRQNDYKNKLLSCYPIHPKLFDFFYGKWTNLEKFQKTRGVLRLMAKVIYTLWQRGDRSTLIMPCDIPLDASEVHSEFTKLLGRNWNSIVNLEIDGESSKPRKLEQQNLRFDRLSAARKLSRSIFMATAPVSDGGVNQGVEENDLRLCTIQPTEIESVAVYNDALTKLRTNLYYLYAQGTKYWFGVVPTLRKLVDDKRESYSDDVIFSEIESRLAEWKTKSRGNFKTVHFCPKNPADVPDEQTARLVILSPKDTFDAETVARNFLDERGQNSSRQNKNMLVFLAAELEKLGELKNAVREYKAWTDVLDEVDQINLDMLQRKDAIGNRDAAGKKFTTQLSQTYCRLIYPVSNDDANLNLPLQVAQIECTNGDNISAASAKLMGDEKLLPKLGGDALKRILDEQNFIWKNGDKVNVKQLWEYFAKFYYMPRLVDEKVLLDAIRKGVEAKIFGLADDENISDVQFGDDFDWQVKPTDFLVKAEVAQKIHDAKKITPDETVEPEIIEDVTPSKTTTPNSSLLTPNSPKPLPKNFFMSAELDPVRYVKQISGYVKDVAEVLKSNYSNAETTIRVTIKVSVPDGVSKDMQEIIEANCSDLKVKDFRFEQ